MGKNSKQNRRTRKRNELRNTNISATFVAAIPVSTPVEQATSVKAIPVATPVEQAADVLFPVYVNTPEGKKFVLQLRPADSIAYIRKCLRDSPETCFFTCYDVLLPECGLQLHCPEDKTAISDVADITSGSCHLEMVPALYDDQSLRDHIEQTRDLLSEANRQSYMPPISAIKHVARNSTSTSLADSLVDPGIIDASESATNLLSLSSKEIKCLDDIALSSFNPPPTERRLSGDLIYLDLVTVEGNKYCITGTTKGFYVNSSSRDILDTTPRVDCAESHTLVAILQNLSPKFRRAFRELLDHKAGAHHLENVEFLLPPNSWLGLHPIPYHRRDAARAEHFSSVSLGGELIGVHKDWNEKLQSSRELPYSTQEERIIRDRALYKLSSDFVDAATRGAIAVVNGCIPPINPSKPKRFQMYAYNEILFCFAVDADFDGFYGKQKSEVNPNGDGFGSFEMANTNDREELYLSRHITFASANNELKGTKAYGSADVPGLCNLAMAIIDYRGYRIVAQSILPGTSQVDKATSTVYGVIDNGKRICWSKDFHSKILEAANRLHLKQHTMLDGSGNVFQLAAPVECKGVIGSDGRHYLLDLTRTTPRDVNYTGPYSRFYILRPELILTFCQAKKSNSDCKLERVACASRHANIAVEKPRFAASATETQVSLGVVKAAMPECRTFNLNVFLELEVKLGGRQEEINEDKESVANASSYLMDIVLPKFVEDLCSLKILPLDGHKLTKELHACGINVRYIREVAQRTSHIPHLWVVCCNEILVRAAKHIFKDVLRETEQHDLGHAVSHVLNCLFGNIVADSTIGITHSANPNNQKHSRHHESGALSNGQAKLCCGRFGMNKPSVHLSITSHSLWLDIKKLVTLKYKFELPDDASTGVKKISVVRNLCQKVGISIAARRYDLDCAAPFEVSDILNIQPVVKHHIPVCSIAKDLIEAGKLRLTEGKFCDAHTLLSQAFTILQQVTGPMHRDVAECCRYLALASYCNGDLERAVEEQFDEAIINERCLGFDHPDTAYSYSNLALFCHGVGKTDLALEFMSRASVLFSLVCGPHHSTVINTFIDGGIMSWESNKTVTASRYFKKALEKIEAQTDFVIASMSYHALSLANMYMGDYKYSYELQMKSHAILATQLGEDDMRTKDALDWVTTIGKELEGTGRNSDDKRSDALVEEACDVIMKDRSSAKCLIKAITSPSFNALLPKNRFITELRHKAASRGLTISHQDTSCEDANPILGMVNTIKSRITLEEEARSSNVVDRDSGNQPATGLRAWLSMLRSKFLFGV